MPWRQVDAMTERRQFVMDARQRLMTFTDLGALYGISRVTGYTWLERANASGLDYLAERSRRPHTCPHATPPVLLTLASIALLTAVFPVHPFDLIYNYGIRFLTGTPPLPRRGAPSRAACGLGAVCLVLTAWAFRAGHAVLGYVLGGFVTAVATLVSTTDICIPSLIYRSLFGFPPRRA
jgi:Domain of unknown function (DUF4395)/leucine-zipper of insertion element IS481